MPVMNKVSMLTSTKTLRNVLGHPKPVNLKRLLDTPGSCVLVSLAADELHAAGKMMGRLFLSSLSREIFSRVGMAEKKRNPVRLYVDEFEHFGTSEFETILAEGRRFKLSLVLAHQTLAQLTPKMRSVILGNVGTKVFFRSGQEDGGLLSKDLTGDPKAIRLPDLRVGEAVLWTREGGTISIEVNSPIVRGLGERSARARLFVRELERQWGLPEGYVEPSFSSPPKSTQRSKESNPPRNPRTRMEDWLCD